MRNLIYILGTLLLLSCSGGGGGGGTSTEKSLANGVLDGRYFRFSNVLGGTYYSELQFKDGKKINLLWGFVSLTNGSYSN